MNCFCAEIFLVTKLVSFYRYLARRKKTTNPQNNKALICDKHSRLFNTNVYLSNNLLMPTPTKIFNSK